MSGALLLVGFRINSILVGCPPVQAPILNVFTRDGGGFRHRRATELMFAPRDEGEDPRHVDLIWPLWHVLDMTPGGRGSGEDIPAMQYE